MDEVNENGLNEYKRNCMEETCHLIHRGLEHAYKEVFGMGLTSEFSLGIDQAYDDCEYVASCVPNCENYNCDCDDPLCNDVGQ